MEFQKRLPQSLKETALFMLVISVISVNLIAPLITCLEIGFSLENWRAVLGQIPFLWPCVVLLVILTQKPADKLAGYFLNNQPNSFKATMLIHAVCNVFLMSLVLTVLGTWIGTQTISAEPLYHFFEKWPRNFTIALFVEALIAQPIARSVMAWYHEKKAVTSQEA